MSVFALGHFFFFVCVYVCDIYLSFPLDSFWCKIFFIVGVLGKEEVRHNPRHMLYWTMLAIGSLSAM